METSTEHQVHINFSGKEFRSKEFGGPKDLPTFEEVAELVTVKVKNGDIIESSHELSRIDKIFVMSKLKESNEI